MLYIQKRPEPDKLIQAKRTGLRHYDDMASDVKCAVREQLAGEQGYLCAYCMCRLELDTMQIEHYIAQHPQDSEYDPILTIDYRNMLGVCPGNKGTASRAAGLTCDQSRGNRPLTIDPRNARLVALVKYYDNGKVFSDDPAINRDLQDTLNLNCRQVHLPERRKEVLDKLKNRIYRECKDRTATKAYFQKLYDQLKQREDDKLKPFLGVLLWYLQKKIDRAPKR